VNYQETYASEIFQASQCLQRELNTGTVLRQMLEDHGFQPLEQCRDVYQRGDQRVTLSLVDDVEHTNYQNHEDFWQHFSSHDIIITDNYVTRPTSAQIIRLPDTWFGIYCHTPTVYIDLPDRAFTMPVNRIDFNRTLILLRMHMYGHLQHGYVNFNCANHDHAQAPEQKIQIWQENCQHILDWQGDRYQVTVDQLTPRMPFRNHDLEHDIACQSGGLNVVIETYASDFSVSFSEKIFRALVTPRPWILFGGTHSVARLEAMGFDVMRDLIDHSYDHLRMNDDKIAVFVSANNQHWGRYPQDYRNDLTMRFYQRWYRRFVLPRASRAAEHNHAVLARWQQQWWRDFPVFLHQLNCVLEKT
jgi:hypothetical protein